MDSKALRKLSYGVYLLLAKDGEGKDRGCIINSAFQVTSSPMQLILSLNHENETCKAIKETKRMLLIVLSEKADMEVIKTFGYHSSRDYDKFKDFIVTYIDGLPYIDKGIAYFILIVKQEMETETHTLFLSQVEDAKLLRDEKEMTYAYFHQIKGGSSPKNAPTYIEENKKEKEEKKHHFRCKKCGYLYETEKEELPDDFFCPLCGASKDYFIKID